MKRSFTVLMALVLTLSVFNLKAEQRDTTVTRAIQGQISRYRNELQYPQSVDRFYKQAGYKMMWVAPIHTKTPLLEGMLLLDCVLQFGLSHADYHPAELTYDHVRKLTEEPNHSTLIEKAGFDVLFTDALISFMNNLHYGKLNAIYPASRIDSATDLEFSADNFLLLSIKNKDFMTTLLSVQPQTEEYIHMQGYMRLLKGQYLDDCYEVPEKEVRQIAINMERLRWLRNTEPFYLQINIPSYTLKLHEVDSTYTFKLIVGKPEAPTPTLESKITYFTTAPEWKVPRKIFYRELLPKAIKDENYLYRNHYAIYDEKGNYVETSLAVLKQIRKDKGGYSMRQSSGCDNALGHIVFRFPNSFDIYLHDTPEQKLFKKEERAFSHGCVRVEHAQQLTELLLKYDGATEKIDDVRLAIKEDKTKSFSFKKPIPIQITYLTCEMKEGILVTYKDLYNMDERLEMALYGTELPFVVNRKK